MVKDATFASLWAPPLTRPPLTPNLSSNRPANGSNAGGPGLGVDAAQQAELTEAEQAAKLSEVVAGMRNFIDYEKAGEHGAELPPDYRSDHRRAGGGGSVEAAEGEDGGVAHAAKGLGDDGDHLVALGEGIGVVARVGACARSLEARRASKSMAERAVRSAWGLELEFVG